MVSPESSSTPENLFALHTKQRKKIINAASDRSFELKAHTMEDTRKQRVKQTTELTPKMSTLPAGGKGYLSPISKRLTSVSDKGTPLQQSHQVVRTITDWGRLSTSNISSPPPEPEIKTVVLIKTQGKSLGFTVCGGIESRRGDLGIYIKTVTPGGLAAQDGRMREGDELLEVNGRSFAQCTHEQAASIIKVCF